MPKGPIPDSYWVKPGQLLAGEYPGARRDGRAKERLRRFLKASVTLFIDLTEAREHGLRTYDRLLREEARALGATVEHRRIPIEDGSTPSVEEMIHVLNDVDAALDGIR